MTQTEFTKRTQSHQGGTGSARIIRVFGLYQTNPIPPETTQDKWVTCADGYPPLTRSRRLTALLRHGGPVGIDRREPSEPVRTIEDYTVRLARALNVIGLMNVQYAIQNGVVYVLEVNPRASRTVPYVSKATGVPLPKIAVGLMWGRKLADYADLTGGRTSGTLPAPQIFVKSPVFPFNKFHGVDPALGPEMRSTGEVMGVGINFGEAFLKAQISAGAPLPDHGTVFLSVNDRHKPEAVEIARRFAGLGFSLVATRGTAATLRNAGLLCRVVFKVNEGRPNVVDLLKGGSIQLAIYTTTGAPAFLDEKSIRRSAVTYRVPCITTMSGARAAADAVAARRRDPIRVWSLQEIHSAKPSTV